MQIPNSCKRCGHPFDLSEEDISEDKCVFWPGLGDICTRCYLDMLESEKDKPMLIE